MSTTAAATTTTTFFSNHHLHRCNLTPSHHHLLRRRSHPHLRRFAAAPFFTSPRLATASPPVDHHGKPPLADTNYFQALQTSFNSGFPDVAADVLERAVAGGHVPNAIFCTKLITALSSSPTGGLRRAERVLELLELHGIPDAVAYNAFLTALCRSNHVSAAFRLFSRMRCDPSTATFNILITALCSRRRLDEAFSLFRRMLADDRFPPDNITYNVLVDAFAAEGGLARVSPLLNAMATQGLAKSTHTYNVVLRCLCREGRVEEAWGLLRQLAAGGSDGSSIPNVASYNTVLQGLLTAGRWADGEALITEMDGVAPNTVTYNILVSNLSAAGRIADAERVLVDMSHLGLKPDNYSFDPVVSAYCRQGRMDLAVDFMQRMTASCGRWPGIVMYNALLSAMCKRGKAAEAAMVLQQLEESGSRSNTCSYNTVVGGLWSCGQRQAAVELLGRMLNRGLVPNEITYNMLVSCFCKERMVEEAMELVGCMVADGMRPSVITYNAILLGLCESKRTADAISIFICEMMGVSDDAKCNVTAASGGYSGSDGPVMPNDRTYWTLLEGVVLEGLSQEAEAVAERLRAHKMISFKCLHRIKKTSSAAKLSASSTSELQGQVIHD